MTIESMATDVDPVLVTVTGTAVETVPCALFAYEMVDTLRVTGGRALPVPVSVTDCGDPVAVSVTVSLPESDAAEAGKNATYTEQEAPAASEVPQVPICWNDVGLVPASTIEFRVTAEALVFFTVTTCAVVATPTPDCGKAIEVGDNVMVPPPVPVPLSVAVCGEPDALSVTASVTLNASAAPGLNSTETVQLALAASDAPQVLPEIRNEPTCAPVRASEVSVTDADPVFFTMTVCAALVEPTAVEGNVIVVGDSVIAPVPAAVPVPLNPAVWGEPVALSATESEALNAAADPGLNSTETVQVALAASDAPQLLAEIRNELGFVPVRVSEVSVTDELPVFLTVTTCAALVEPTVVEGNASDVGDSVTVAAPAAPPV
jgi:hypothetical protein